MVRWIVFLGLVATIVALSVVLAREVRRIRRHHRVARELDGPRLQSVAPARSSARHRSDMVRSPLPSVRSREPRDPGAARIIAFHDELAHRGCYVHELSIQRRLN